RDAGAVEEARKQIAAERVSAKWMGGVLERPEQRPTNHAQRIAGIEHGREKRCERHEREDNEPSRREFVAEDQPPAAPSRRRRDLLLEPCLVRGAHHLPSIRGSIIACTTSTTMLAKMTRSEENSRMPRMTTRSRD